MFSFAELNAKDIKISSVHTDMMKIVKKKSPWGITPVIVPFYTPETRFGIAGGVIFSNLPNSDYPNQKKGHVTVGAAYTQLNQISAELVAEKFFQGDDYKLNLQFDFSKFPDFYYGIGGNTPDSMKEKYTPVKYVATGSFLWESINHLYIGPLYKFFYIRITDKESSGELNSGLKTGSNGSRVSAAGFQVSWDNRDSVLFTHSGMLLDLKSCFYHAYMGSAFDFVQVEFDFRQFFQIYGEHVFALQEVITSSSGDVPLEMMPRLGGRYVMRGFYEGRYRDENYIAVQAEYRFPLFWRIGGSAFFGAGEVASHFKDFNLHNIRLAGGAGIRASVDKKEKINLRLDVGLSGFRETSDVGVYLTIMEAF